MRHFRRSYLKTNKVSKNEDTSKVEFAYYHFWRRADAVCQKLSKLVHACWNYGLPKLVRFLSHSVHLMSVYVRPSVRPYVHHTPVLSGDKWSRVYLPQKAQGQCVMHTAVKLYHIILLEFFLFIALITLRRPISYAHRFCFHFIFCFDVSFCDAALRIALSVRLSVPYMPTVIGQ